MTARRAGSLLRRPEDPQRATFLELFFDLAFVVALAQLSNELHQHLNWSGAVGNLVLLLAVWRIWVSTTWITNRFDPQRPTVQLLVTVILLGGLLLAVAVPQAFGTYGLIFAGVYVAVLIVPRVFVALAARGHERQRVARRALLWSGVSAPLWIAGAFMHGAVRGALWTLGMAVDYAAYALGFRVPGAGRVGSWEPPVAAEHLAERYRQVFIIALGDLIVVSGLTFSGVGFAPDRTGAFVVSVATAALLLRIYAYQAGEVLSGAFAAVPMSARLGRWVAYVHLAMVAGVVVVAVGDELVIARPSGRTPLAWAVVVLAGPALFLAGRAGFEYAVFARVSWDRVIGVLVLAALIPVALFASPLSATIAAAAVLAGVAIADEARGWGRPLESPSPSAAAREPS